MKHTTTFATLLAATMLGGTATAGITYTYFGSYGGHDYYTTELSLEYYDAREAAEQLGIQLGYDSYLASITDEAESDWVQSISLDTMWIDSTTSTWTGSGPGTAARRSTGPTGPPGNRTRTPATRTWS